MYKGKGKIGNKLVRLWTRSQYSHCELVIGDMWYSSSLMDGGVRAKAITLNPGHWDFIELPAHMEARVLAYFNKTGGYKYSWLNLITSQLFNTNSEEDGAAFCSQWCAAALGLPNPATYSPKTLGDLVRWLQLK
jgi:hypothetical protein